MNNNLSWGERQLKMMQVLGTAEPRGSSAKPMIEKTNTNRIIISERQAGLSIALKQEYAGILSTSADDNAVNIWSWINNLPDVVHEYQMTMQGVSRKDYKEVVGLLAKAQSNNGKNTISVEASGGNAE